MPSHVFSPVLCLHILEPLLNNYSITRCPCPATSKPPNWSMYFRIGGTTQRQVPNAQKRLLACKRENRWMWLAFCRRDLSSADAPLPIARADFRFSVRHQQRLNLIISLFMSIRFVNAILCKNGAGNHDGSDTILLSCLCQTSASKPSMPHLAALHSIPCSCCGRGVMLFFHLLLLLCLSISKYSCKLRSRRQWMTVVFLLN